MNAEQLEEQIRESLDRIDLERADAERKRNSPTMAERTERIAALRLGYRGYVLNDLMVATFKRLIRWRFDWYATRPAWAALHGSMTAYGAPTKGVWFRAHEGTYPCVHDGVLIGFCSPEYAAAFEELAARDYLIVEMDFSDVDGYGVPRSVVSRSAR